jgi:NAD(P)-dependent dehydrogenase (short-subunit alcohol dehydrogenase family)
MAQRLQGKIAVVTGGASGIGAATARVFREEGASVVLADIQTTEGERLANEIGALFVECDVTIASDVKHLEEVCRRDVGVANVVFANAGLSLEYTIDEMTEEIWDRLIRLNLTSTWLTCKAFLPGMYQARDGSIIATASQLGLIGMRGVAAYAAAKAGVINFMRCVAAEYSEIGIRANALCPGPTRTEGTIRMFSAAPDPAQALRSMYGKTIVQRLAEPDEIAKAALFLASDDSTYVTGTALVVDGGHTAI